MRLVFLGPPGAGKGTVAARVSEEFEIPHISTGDILRKAINDETPVGLMAKKYMDAGQLVPDDVILEIVKERLSKPDCEKGFLFDGFPRTVLQAEELSGITELDCVISIEIPDGAIVARLAGRRYCHGCNRSFHINRIGKRDDCPNCGNKLTIREDDKPETILNRLAVYHKSTAPLAEFYKSRGLLKPVNGDDSYDEVFESVRRLVICAGSCGGDCCCGEGKKA